MLKKIKRVLTWIAIILALLVGWKAYDEYQFVQETNRAMELLGEPQTPVGNVGIEQDGTVRWEGIELGKLPYAGEPDDE